VILFFGYGESIMHPIQHVFTHLTSAVKHLLPAPTPIDGHCSCCGRAANEFGFEGYSGFDSYKMPYIHCAACESFVVGDIDTLGIERGKSQHADGSVTGVPHKFGMLAGSGTIIDHDGNTVVFMPPGTYTKMPPSFLKRFHVIACTTGQQITHINKMNLVFPVVYIQDFGKKTKALINGLRYSPSRSQLIICTDNGNSSTSEFLNTINLDVVVEIASIRKTLKNTLWNDFKRQIYLLCYGSQSPTEFTVFMQKETNKPLMAIYRNLPIDPHKRLELLRLVDKVVE
jgi:hypothetical protein